MKSSYLYLETDHSCSRHKRKDIQALSYVTGAQTTTSALEYTVCSWDRHDFMLCALPLLKGEIRWWHHFLAAGSRETTVPRPGAHAHPMITWATVPSCACVRQSVTSSLSTSLTQLILNQTEHGPSSRNGGSVCTCVGWHVRPLLWIFIVFFFLSPVCLFVPISE